VFSEFFEELPIFSYAYLSDFAEILQYLCVFVAHNKHTLYLSLSISIYLVYGSNGNLLKPESCNQNKLVKRKNGPKFTLTQFVFYANHDTVKVNFRGFLKMVFRIDKLSHKSRNKSASLQARKENHRKFLCVPT